MRFSRMVALVALGLIIPVAVGLGLEKKRRAKHNDLDNLQQMVEAVKQAYEGAQNPESAIIMAELGLHEMGKKGNLKDAPARLEKALEQVETPGLRNFTRFLIAAAHAEAKDHEAAAAQLDQVITENAKHLASADPGK